MGGIQPQQHFLIVTYPAQGHINPAIHLGTFIARITGARITFSTSISAHRKMFTNLDAPDQEITNGPITYLPFTDGYDEGFKSGDHDDPSHVLSQFGIVGSKSLSSIIDKLSSDGRRVDCVIYTFFLSWAANVAREHGIPSALYWIQPATVFAIYYHAFHGYDAVIDEVSKDPLSSVNLPGLPQLQIRDLPSFLTTPSSSADKITSAILSIIKGSFLNLDRERSTGHKPKVLVNTFDELEAYALSAIDDLDLIAVGPSLQSFSKDNAEASIGFDLLKPDEKAYMEWLDSKPKKTVVYVSFGSMSMIKKEQIKEILMGLKASGCPFLWVVRKDSRYEGFEQEEIGENGMIVEWCSQVQVLSHASVGCFVTHCGWNSTLETIVCGVPTIGVPQWTDQGTNAMLMEKTWGMGVRSELNEDGILESEELKRCLELVLGEGEKGEDIRKKAELWKEKATDAVGGGGSSYQNLRSFVDEIAKSQSTI